MLQIRAAVTSAVAWACLASGVTPDASAQIAGGRFTSIRQASGADPECRPDGEPVARLRGSGAVVRIQMTESGVAPPQLILSDFLRFAAKGYPRESRRLRQEGVVSLCLCVRASGEVAWAAIDKSSGWPLLDKATLEGIVTVRFEPARDARGRAVDYCDPPHKMDVVWQLEERAPLSLEKPAPPTPPILESWRRWLDVAPKRPATTPE